MHTNKNTKGFDDMKNYKEIDNLLQGYSKSEELFTENTFLISHIADYMNSTKKTKIDVNFINYMENNLIKENFSKREINNIINRIKFIFNSNQGIVLYLKGLQRYKNILFVNNTLDTITKKIITYPNGKIDISNVNSNDIYLLNQLLNLDIPKYQKDEIIDLLSTIIEIS